MFCINLMEKFKTQRKWVATGVYGNNKPIYIASLVVTYFITLKWGRDRVNVQQS
jgi:hypothetical protein